VDGKRLDSFPIVPLLDRAVPVYSDMPGWQEPITDVRRFDDLPAAARDYVLEIERLLDCPIRFVSVGAERDAMIVRGA
jgi:adenylosuccinate synthase